MRERLLRRYSEKPNDLDLKKMGAHSVTFVIITKNRPEMTKTLMKSILKTRLVSCSIVSIDDSGIDDFIKTRKFLKSRSIQFKQLSSSQAGRLAEERLKETNLTSDERSFIEKCTGLSSPFVGYVEQFLEPGMSKLDPSEYLQFAPYSVARNLGIYIAVRFFNPDIIVFLDDDCLILYPEKLVGQLQLVEAKLNRRRIVAVGGLYKDLSPLSFSRNRSSEKTLGILRGLDTFIRKSFMVEKARFKTMPPHMLGGVLILHKRAFSVIPFDPYMARGEDHSYALDLKRFLGKDEVAVRDNRFVIGHQKELLKNARAEKSSELNVLRDIFRFVYARTKTGRSFITLFLVRWSLTSLCHLFLNPSKYRRCKGELLALLFIAPRYARENGSKFSQSIKAWNKFLCQSEM